MELDDCILIGDKDNDCFIVNPNENIKSNLELAETHNAQGGSFYKKGQFLTARSHYNEAIQLDPNNPVYYANRAAANMSLNELNNVSDDLDKAISLDPSYLKAYVRKFNYLISIGDLNRAEHLIDKIKEIEKENKQIEQLIAKLSNIRNNEELFNKAVSKEMYRDGLFYIDKILEICQSSINVKLRKAEMLAYLFRHEDVVNIVDPIIRKDNTNSEAFFIRGLSLYYQDNLDKAIAHFQQALGTDPEHKKSIKFIKRAKLIRSIKEQGKEAVNRNDLNKAIENYKQALNIDKDHKLGNAKLCFNLSVVYGKQKNIKEALKECTEAIKLDGNYDKAYLKRAILYDDLEMYEESVKDYEYLYKKLKTKETKDYLEKAKIKLTRSKRKNYYNILGIAKSADDSEIKKAFHKRAMEFHPDRHVDASEEELNNTEKKFKDVNEAYSCLIDPEKRRRYDNGYDINAETGPSFNNNAFRMFCDDDIINNLFFDFNKRGF